MTTLRTLPTLDQRQRGASPKPPKGTATRQRRRRRIASETELRDECWLRDESHSRASGAPVVRGHVDPKRRGEVAHIRARSVEPGLKFLLSDVVLLTAEEHKYSDARTAPGGLVRLRIIGRNGNRAMTFVHLDERGRELWRHRS